jgi:hypothetical protein
MLRFVDSARPALSSHNLAVPRCLFGKVRDLIVRDPLLRKSRAVLANDVLHPTSLVTVLEPGMLSGRVNSGNLSAQWPDANDVFGGDLASRCVHSVNHVLAGMGTRRRGAMSRVE